MDEFGDLPLATAPSSTSTPWFGMWMAPFTVIVTESNPAGE